MMSAETTNLTLQSLAIDFFQKSAGSWNSQRRYYTLNKDVEPQEVESVLKISFLSQGAAELIVSSFRNSYFNLDNFEKKHNTLIATARAGNVIGGGDWSNDRIIPDLIKGAILD